MKSLSLKRFFTPISIVAFVAGFSMMAFELVAARILAPSIGSSTYVWTSVIGVIMIALSFGYYMGGTLADARKKPIDVAALCFIAAFCVLATILFTPHILQFVVEMDIDNRIQGVIAALALFAPASLALGMISPYVAKLNITSLETSGQSVAMLSAVNSIGSIAGTFIAGFILFSFIGSRETLVVIIWLLTGAGWLLAAKQHIVIKIVLSLALITASGAILFAKDARSIDTPTAHYSIVQYTDDDGRTIRGIMSGPNGVQSGVDVNAPNKLAFWYTNQFADIIAQSPHNQRILILGGGTYTLPRHLAATYPQSHIDVVEIDPALTAIARAQFYYNDPKNIDIYNEDARTFVNQTKKEYDVIIVDAYNDISIPFSLLTREYGAQIQRILADDGVVAVNVIAATSGPCQPLYRAFNATYAPLGAVHYEKAQQSRGTRGNMVIAYGGHLPAFSGYTAVETTAPEPYTDNYMPADALQQQCQQTHA